MTVLTQNNRRFTNHLNHTKLFVIMLAFIISMPFITHISKADIIVDDDGTGDYESIQDAIDNAAVGETIWVKAGSYNEQLTISTPGITLNANNGDEPILYLSSYSPGIDVQTDNVSIRGFKIYGNFNPGGAPTIRASASADKLVVTDNTFQVVTGEIGNTVLYLETGAENVWFTANTINNYDIGVYFNDHSNAILNFNNWNNVDQTIYHAASIQGSNTWYGTIQDAIDVSITNDVISVVPGIFYENLLINKSISLMGEQNDVNPINGRSNKETILNGGTSSAIRIEQNTSDVEINGFKVWIPNKSGASNEAGVLFGPACSMIEISYNIFENITDGGGVDTVGDETYAIMGYGRDAILGGQHDITIQHNLIQNVEEYGIAINDNSSFVTISGNKITDLIGSDHTADPIWDPSWPDIICSAIHMGGQVGPVNNITIDNNILMTEVMGDGLATPAGGGISFAGVAEWNPPNRPWMGFEEIYISNNKITNNSMGIIALAGNTTGEITIHNKNDITDGNNLSGNTLFAMNNFISDIYINAAYNWWGDITGPFNLTDNPLGLGGNITGNITFWPWFEFGTAKGGYSIPPFVDYDVEGPQVNLGEIIKESSEIEINAQDDESGLKFLTYRYWNTTHRWSPWITYTGPISFSAQGNHRVQYNATDNAGTSTVISGDFVYMEHRVDDVAPVIKVVYPNTNVFEFDTIPIEWEAADQIFDQGQLKTNGSLTITEDYPGHIQSFIPTESYINSVQLFLSGDDANISVKLFSKLFPVPTVIAQSKHQVQNIGAPEWIDFPFSSSIILDTEETYYIGVTQEIYGDTGFTWYFFNDSNISKDKYPYGQSWVKETDALVSQSTMDFAFKTMYWQTDVDIDVQYSITGMAPWSTIAASEDNDGLYIWDTATYGIPDGPNYRIRIIGRDEIQNTGYDTSDEDFIIDNEGPAIYNIEIKDLTIDDNAYTKNGDSIEISASIGGDPEEIWADLSTFGKGTEVPPTSYTGGIAKWLINGIICSPPNGEVTITIYAEDATGDSEVNTGSIYADNSLPEITIIKPRAGLYFLDSMRILPFSYPFIIGQITVEVEALDNISGINTVEFYLEDDLEKTDNDAPYNWLWDRAATGFFDIEIVVYDNVGHMATAVIDDLFIINLDIIGHI